MDEPLLNWWKRSGRPVLPAPPARCPLAALIVARATVVSNVRRGANVSVSIVIPVLNEAGVIAGALRSLREQGPHEIVVVDGGSADDTARVAEGLADRVLRGPRGRAAQM